MSAHLQTEIHALDNASPSPARGSSHFLNVRLLERLRCDAGATMVETAIAFMMLMTLLLGTIECSVMAYTYAILQDAAREGVRYASVHGIDSSSCEGPSSGCDSTAANAVSDVTAYAQTFAGNLGTLHVVVSYPDGASTGTSRVTVTVSETYSPVFAFPGIAESMSVSSSGRIVY